MIFKKGAKIYYKRASENNWECFRIPILKIIFSQMAATALPSSRVILQCDSAIFSIMGEAQFFSQMQDGLVTCLINEIQLMWYSGTSKAVSKEAFQILSECLGKFALKMLLLVSSQNSVRSPGDVQRPCVGTLANDPS